MLLLRALTLVNFGPFKHEQRIDFDIDHGVLIVYGENMRGKTTLLNAIRYALFGKALTRGSVEIRPSQIGNWESIAEGTYGFKVILDFQYEDLPYQLTRECRLRPGVAKPSSDSDYIQDYFLQRDGSVLGPDEAALELTRIMPETVSRFFLFDGELLQQYEELLRSESDMGRQIKEAIERILGLPVLTNARADLSRLYHEAQNQEAKAAQKNQKTQQLGNAHAQLLERRKAMQDETDRLTQELEKLRQNKIAKEELVKKQERLRSLLVERDRLQSDIDVSNARLQEKENRRKDLLATAWRGMLGPRIKSVRDTLETELTTKREQRTRAHLAQRTVETITEALGEGRCPTCLQEVLGEAKNRLEALLNDRRNEKEESHNDELIAALERRISMLRQEEGTVRLDLLEEVNETIDDLRVSIATVQDRLREIREQTANLDESEIRRLYSEYEKAVEEISVVERGIKEQNKILAEINDNIAKVEAELVKKGGVDLERERNRRELCDRLHQLFDEGVKVYRDQLRDKVEKDATALFLQLTSESEYAGLSINENYGLTIQHQDGNRIPVRSAGAEHIVALSLMGALQKNAPLQGPLIMDSPFGRLDSTHTTRVVRSLPKMARQVILLVYESELEPKLARAELLGTLKHEYRIQRRTARYSMIERVV